MKVLVAGGMGYIGSHTCVELAKRGYEVIIADNLSNSNIQVLDCLRRITPGAICFENTNLNDPLECKNLFEKHCDFSAVINFAAFKSIGESVSLPLKYYSNNLAILFNLLSNMERWGVQSFVQSSSCSVYGEPDQLPINENHPLKAPLSPYANTKQIAEAIIKDTSYTSSIQSICLRYFNPIGADESRLIGEFPNGTPNNLMPFITQTAIGEREVLQVFGNDYPTPDGTCIRDYIHVSDLALSHLHALEKLLQRKPKQNFEVFNIGTGKGYSVLEIIHTFEKISNLKLNYVFAERRKGDVPMIWADASLAKKELHWEAKHSLEEMVHSAWEWELCLHSNK